LTVVDSTLDSTPSAPDRPRTAATVARVAAFVAALALTAAVGWQAGRLVAASPPQPPVVNTSIPIGS
jgi:hypothetical protein